MQCRVENRRRAARRAVVATAEFERFFFQRFLQGDSRQGPTGKIRLRIDAHHDARVRVAFVARVLAHAVGHHASSLGSCRDHHAARTHAEAVDRTAIARVMDQLVVRGSELRVACEPAKAREVDQRLRMFDAKSNRERLGFEEHAAPLEHAQRVARTVS